MISSILSKPFSRSSGSMRPKPCYSRRAKTAYALMLALAAASAGSSALAQSERWFTYELSVFSNESPADRLQEPPHPLAKSNLLAEGSVTLTTLAELLAIDPALFTEAAQTSAAGETSSSATEPAASLPNLPSPIDAASSFRFVDLQRDPDIALPASESDFQQTNRALERSPDYRLLYHAVWRAPLAEEDESAALSIDTEELAGTVDLHFNARRDRIVLDTMLGLAVGTGGYYVHSQSREMRSGEFHYLDSPALGVIFLAQPYELPPLTERETQAID